MAWSFLSAERKLQSMVFKLCGRLTGTSGTSRIACNMKLLAKHFQIGALILRQDASNPGGIHI